jgi:hypothetical protein
MGLHTISQAVGQGIPLFKDTVVGLGLGYMNSQGKQKKEQKAHGLQSNGAGAFSELMEGYKEGNQGLLAKSSI